MLTLKIPAIEALNEDTNEFINTKECTLTIEHSLISISKWESRWKKPYLSRTKKTKEETIDYIKCMSINNIDEKIYDILPGNIIKEIEKYVNDPMTATTFTNYSEGYRGGNSENITSEIIYYQMISYNIPVEFEKWHISRLLTLIEVCSIKNNPNSKKRPSHNVARQYSELNKKRKAAMHTKG